MSFMIQVYAPHDDDADPHPQAFHRTLYVFVCKSGECWTNHSRYVKSLGSNDVQPQVNLPAKIIRSQLPRVNSFYPPLAPEVVEPGYSSHVSLSPSCVLCSLAGSKTCGQCRSVQYCSRRCQKLDWPAHKLSCGAVTTTAVSSEIEQLKRHAASIINYEKEFTIQSEEESEIAAEKEGKDQDVQTALMGREDTARGLEGEGVESEEIMEEAFAGQVKGDASFLSFQKRLDIAPDQILRYDRGSIPLELRSKSSPVSVVPVASRCSRCDAPTTYECSIMSQLLHYLQEFTLDFAMLHCFTCSADCPSSAGENYVAEQLQVVYFTEDNEALENDAVSDSDEDDSDAGDA